MKVLACCSVWNALIRVSIIFHWILSVVSSYNLQASPPPSSSGIDSSYTCSRRDALTRGPLASVVIVTTGLLSSIGISTAASPAWAMSPEEASAAYDTYAATYDDLDGGKASDVLGIDVARSILFSQAKGSVLEIGCGTGLNLAKYDPTKLTSLTLLDVSEGMLQKAKQRVTTLSSSSSSSAWKTLPVNFVQADGTSELVSLFGSSLFDTVVDSFSFCVMGNQGAKDCLNQIKQVVKPDRDGGQILLLENTRSSNPILGMYQDASADAAASVGGKGCLYNQDVGSMIRATKSLEIVREDLYAAGVFRSYLCRVNP
jgi:methyltransferase OMS1